MRKITEDSINCFMTARKFHRSNTEVDIYPNVTVLKLHTNEIAWRYNNPSRTLSISTADWKTNTTKERLNGIPGVSISQKDFTWYLNGKEWDGKRIDVSNDKG